MNKQKEYDEIEDLKNAIIEHQKKYGFESVFDLAFESLCGLQDELTSTEIKPNK